MKKIYSFALDSAIAAGKFNAEALKKVLSDMDEDKAIRVIEAIIGCVNVDELYASIPKVSIPYDTKKSAQFDWFNYFDNRVGYTYQRTEVKYFASLEEAEEYTASGKYDWSKYKCRQEGEYVFEGQWTSKATDTCSLETWMNGAKKEGAE